MAYGLADVVNQRRMIDESPAGEEFKRNQRGKLDALLALAESHDCRRVRLLGYFGEASVPCGPLQNACDNCRTPPATWDATEAARKALSLHLPLPASTGGQRFGAGHLIDVLRGKATDKVAQFGHEQLSTFGIGAALSEAQWRAVLRQLIALGHLRSDGEFNTLALTETARAVLRGEVRAAAARGEPGDAARQGRAHARARAARRQAAAAGARRRRARALRRAQGLARARSRARTTCRPTSSSTTRPWPRWPSLRPTRSMRWAGSAASARRKLAGLRRRDPARPARRLRRRDSAIDRSLRAADPIGARAFTPSRPRCGSAVSTSR